MELVINIKGKSDREIAVGQMQGVNLDYYG